MKFRWSAISTLALALGIAGCFAGFDGFSAGLNHGGDDAATEGGGGGGGSTDGSPTDALVSDAPVVNNDAGNDGGTTDQVFTDDFARPDGPDVGNGWVMKHPGAFQLKGGAAQRLFPSSAFDFDDNIVYRAPASESHLDVEVSCEVTFSISPPGYAQIHARVQPSTLTTAGQLDSYILFIENTMADVVLARQHGGSSGYVALKRFTLSPPLDLTSTFRLRLRVSGASDVALTGIVERLATSGDQIIGQATATDTDPSRITTAGTVGFSGGRPEADGIYKYDNFKRVAF